MNKAAILIGAGIIFYFAWKTAQGNQIFQAGEGGQNEYPPQASGENAMSTWGAGIVPDEYAGAISSAERQYGIPSGLLARQLYEESRYRPDIISGATRSPVGATGIAQFMPDTAAEFGINPLDPFQSINAAASYMARLYRMFNSWPLALAAYNWGPGNVARKGIAAAPLETRRYVASITADVPV